MDLTPQLFLHWYDDDDYMPLTLMPVKIGGSGEGGGGNSIVRRGRSHKCLSVKEVGCEEQDKTWMVELGSPPQEGQRELRVSHILSQ